MPPLPSSPFCPAPAAAVLAPLSANLSSLRAFERARPHRHTPRNDTAASTTHHSSNCTHLTRLSRHAHASLPHARRTPQRVASFASTHVSTRSPDHGLLTASRTEPHGSTDASLGGTSANAAHAVRSPLLRCHFASALSIARYASCVRCSTTAAAGDIPAANSSARRSSSHNCSHRRRH